MSLVILITLMTSLAHAADDKPHDQPTLSPEDSQFVRAFRQNYASLLQKAKAYSQLDAQLDQAERKWLEDDYRRTLKREPSRSADEPLDQYTNRLNKEVERYLEKTTDGDFDKIARYRKMSESVNQDIMTYLNRPGNEVPKNMYLAQRGETPRFRIRAVGQEFQNQYLTEARKIFPQDSALTRQMNELENAIELESRNIANAIAQAEKDYSAAKQAIFENRDAAIRAIRGKEPRDGEVYQGILDRAESAIADSDKKYQETRVSLDEKLKTVGHDTRMRFAKTSLRSAILNQVFVYDNPSPEEHFKFANQRIAHILRSGLSSNTGQDSSKCARAFKSIGENLAP